MKEVALNIPDMQSSHCQMRVNNAIKSVPGTEIVNLTAGKLTVDVDSTETEEAVVNAIENAGYSVENK